MPDYPQDETPWLPLQCIRAIIEAEKSDPNSLRTRSDRQLEEVIQKENGIALIRAAMVLQPRQDEWRLVLYKDICNRPLTAAETVQYDAIVQRYYDSNNNNNSSNCHDDEHHHPPRHVWVWEELMLKMRAADGHVAVELSEDETRILSDCLAQDFALPRLLGRSSSNAVAGGECLPANVAAEAGHSALAALEEAGAEMQDMQDMTRSEISQTSIHKPISDKSYNAKRGKGDNPTHAGHILQSSSCAARLDAAALENFAPAAATEEWVLTQARNVEQQVRMTQQQQQQWLILTGSRANECRSEDGVMSEEMQAGECIQRRQWHGGVSENNKVHKETCNKVDKEAEKRQRSRRTSNPSLNRLFDQWEDLHDKAEQANTRVGREALETVRRHREEMHDAQQQQLQEKGSKEEGERDDGDNHADNDDEEEEEREQLGLNSFSLTLQLAFEEWEQSVSLQKEKEAEIESAIFDEIRRDREKQIKDTGK